MLAAIVIDCQSITYKKLLLGVKIYLSTPDVEQAGLAKAHKNDVNE